MSEKDNLNKIEKELNESLENDVQNVPLDDPVGEILKDYRQQREEYEKRRDPEEPEKAELSKAEIKAEKEKAKAEAKVAKAQAKEEAKAEKARSREESKPRREARAKKAKKIILIVIIVIAVIVAAVFGGGAIYHRVTTAYLDPYIEAYPNVDFPEGIEERFCEYYAENEGVVGYIEIDDIALSEYVISADVESDVTLDGSNSTDGLDFNTVIYLSGDGVAESLQNAYSTAENYLNSTQSITYSTLFEDYSFNVIGAYYTNANAEDDSGYVFPFNVTATMTTDSLDSFTDRVYSRFLYNSEYYLTNDIIKEKGNIITLAVQCDTVNGVTKEGAFYFVVVGVLNGETVTTAEENTNVHWPQIWYDETGEENTFRFASQWYPEIVTGEESTSQMSADEFSIEW